MKVFKFRLQDLPEVYHTLAVDNIDAVLDICEQFECTEQDISDLQQVQPISSRKPKK